jgi:adenine-specific DNA-methyltransferase
MMYPRLYLARNLLREDGAIFITIDDTEVANLRTLANEVFGEENFVANIVWEKKYAKQNDATWLSTSHDHILLYAKHKAVWRPNPLERTADQLKGYSNPDSDPRGPWQSVVYTCNKSRAERPNLYYSIIHPTTGKDVLPNETRVWGYDSQKHQQHVAERRLWWGAKGELEKPRIKVFLSEVGKGVVPDTLWLRGEVGDNQDAKRTLLELIPDSPFDTPKPPSLVMRMLSIATFVNTKDIVLDFFAGSGTTAQAVLEQNVADQGDRKFILVQLPEITNRTDYPTIADITKERVRRSIKKLKGDENGTLNFDGVSAPDRGFRVFKLAESNFTTWDAQVAHEPKALQNQLDFHVDHIREGRTADDILYELLLKSGFPLTTPVEKLTLAGKTVHSVASGALMICLERELTLELIRAIADAKPERVVCLDEGFAGNDQLKANAVQTFKTKGIVKFQTV